MSRVDELTASLRAHRRRWRHPLLVRTEHTRGQQRRRPGGHGTNRPGDRLHRYFAGEPRDGDIAYHQGMLGMIETHKGDVPAIAAELGVGVRTLRGWMMKFQTIRSAVKVAQLEAQLGAEKARCNTAKVAPLCSEVTP